MVIKQAYRLNIRPIIDQLRKFPEVDEVSYQGRLISRIESYYEKFVKLMTGLLILVLVVSVFIISNTVRLTIYAKKELIQSLQLIGATNVFVKAPFIIEGVFHGLIGAALASLLLISGLNFGSKIIYSVAEIQLEYNALFLVSLLGLIGILISFIGSSRAISRFLK